jgi:uncharacterized BrkB/YihY/UPF0761 family membrane protein
MADRDAEVGGGIMAGALAYRLFIWLLPAALVAIAGLGYAADAASVEPQDAAESVGLAGIVSSSVANSAQSSSRAYALLVGLPILLLATRSFLRTLTIAHRLVWTDVRTAARKPTAVATVRLLVAMVGLLAISTLAATARHASLIVGTIALLVLVIPYSAVWLVVSLYLPHRDAPWQSLLPGALVLGIGLEMMQAATTYFIGPSAESKQGTYGSLGLAAALLLGLFFISRILVATAVVNATLWERRARGREQAQATDESSRAAVRLRQ